MRIGDLVGFWSSFPPFNNQYKCRNPGVVLAITEGCLWGSPKTSVEVLWANKEVTTEHSSYLQPIREKNESR